jgi:ankyrin repeat protein
MADYAELVGLIVEKNLLDLQIALTLGADPNCRDEKGWTLLHWAAQEGSPPIIRYLLEAGADVQAQDSLGFTPLAIAIGEAENGMTDKTHALLNSGASPNTRIHGGGGVLHTASAWGYLEIVKVLLSVAGIDVNLRDEEGHTPLYFAKESGTPELIDYLVQHGARD